MVIYLDTAFALNALTDAAALYTTGRLAGQRPRWGRLAAGAALGGVYGAACVVPSLAMLAAAPVQVFTALVLVCTTFGRRRAVRMTVLFYIVSCAMGGGVTAAVALWAQGKACFAALNWPRFLLVGTVCFWVLSVLFHGEARQAAGGRLLHGWVQRGGQTASITALYDTGHALTDGGKAVLTAYWGRLAPLWTGEERRILEQMEQRGAVWCMERLGAGFRLLPYRAVGVSGGLLLCCTAENAVIGGERLGPVTLALAPLPLGAGCDALWGGGKQVEEKRTDAA